MAEFDPKYASRGVANAGLTTGIVGSALGAISSGILPNLFGGNKAVNSEDMPVNRYELNLTQQLEAEKSKNAMLEAHIYTDNRTDEKMKEAKTELRADIAAISGRVDCLEKRTAKNEMENAVFATAANGEISCMQREINRLYGLTQLKIGNSSVCPGWGDVSVTPAAAPTTTTGA